MNIESKGFTIQLDNTEMWSLTYEVRESLISTTRRHWVNHPDKWRENEVSRLNRLKMLCSHMGRIDIYEGTITEVEKILEDHKNSK